MSAFNHYDDNDMLESACKILIYVISWFLKVKTIKGRSGQNLSVYRNAR